MRKFAIPAAVVAALALGAAAQASVVGTDNASASAYSDGWTSGDNGAVTGNAFGAWTLTNTGSAGGATGYAGNFIGDSRYLARDSASNPVGADINTSGSAFGLYANQATTAASSAARNFNGDLGVGQTFSVNLAVNYRNGNKGMNLRDSAGNNLFTLNVGSDDYTVYDAATGNGSIGNAYSNNTAFNLSFTQTSAAGGTWTITRSGGVADSDSGTYAGVAGGVNLYNGGTDGGDENNLFANGLSITGTPEPASLALLGVGVAGLLRRRK